MLFFWLVAWTTKSVFRSPSTKKNLCALDVLFRKLCGSFVTPPSNTDWSLEWHEIPHRWNDPARAFTQAAGVKPWSYLVCKHCWTLALIYLNIAGSEEYLLGIHLFDTDLWEGGRTRGIIKSMLSVDTKVRGHGWRRRNSTNNGLHLFDEFYNFC